MSVEQTTQLIQLILNSVLVSVACALLLGGLMARQAAIEERLQASNRQYLDSLEGNPSFRNGTVKRQFRQLQQRYQANRYSVLSVHYALLFAVLSALVLALRTTVGLDGLIPIALGIFIVGIAFLLMGVGLTLVELHLSEQPLLEDIKGLLPASKGEELSRSNSRSRRSERTAGTMPRLNPRSRSRAG